MENTSQKDAFMSYEADAWFERNKQALINYSSDNDRVISLLKEYSINPKRVLEIGCSIGHRLNAIRTICSDCDVFGIEPSLKAIEFGKQKYPGVSFIRGTADDLGFFEKESVDVVVVGFVFYAVDRSIIFKVVSEIDRVLKNGGILIMVDFFAETPRKNVYQHIEKFNAYAYKQNYEEIFLSSNMYCLLDKSTFNHETKFLDASGDYFNKFCFSMVRKDISACYK